LTDLEKKGEYRIQISDPARLARLRQFTNDLINHLGRTQVQVILPFPSDPSSRFASPSRPIFSLLLLRTSQFGSCTTSSSSGIGIMG
jgi:hypothetical protein